MNLKELIDIFSAHATEVEDIHNTNLMAFVEENPGKDIPEYMKDDFNFASAMKTICQELVLIKEKLEMK